jgi:hypothetical protein
MSDSIDPAILKLLAEPGPLIALPPAPEAASDSAAAAIARCRDAWLQAFDSYMKKNARKEGWSAKGKASHEAAIAYRSAMPPLVGHQGIRDFVACAAYGILIEAIPPDRAGQLLYAAQVALSVILRTPKTAPTPPPPIENSVPAASDFPQPQ